MIPKIAGSTPGVPYCFSKEWLKCNKKKDNSGYETGDFAKNLYKSMLYMPRNIENSGNEEPGRETITLTGIPDGTVNEPAIAFLTDEDTGIYRIGENDLGIATAGVNRVNISTTSLTSGLRLLGIQGSAAAPAYSFLADSNTGIYSSGSDEVSIAAGGADVLRIGATNGTLNSVLRYPNGSSGTPAISFTSSTNTGLFSIAGNRLGITCNGIQVANFGTADISFGSTIRGAAGTAALPSYSFGSQNNKGMYRIGADLLGFSTNATERLRISNTAITASVPIIFSDGVAATPGIGFSGSTNTGLYRYSGGVGISLSGTGLFNLESSQCIISAPIFNNTNARLYFSYAAVGTADNVDVFLPTASGTTVRNTGGFVINANNFTVPSSGTYVIFANCNFDINTTGYRLVGLDVNGVKVARNTTNALTGVITQLTTSFIGDLLAGENISIVIRQNSGGSLGIANASLRCMRIY